MCTSSCSDPCRSSPPKGNVRLTVRVIVFVVILIFYAISIYLGWPAATATAMATAAAVISVALVRGVTPKLSWLPGSTSGA